YQDLEPFFAPDGLRLYFVSNRPTDPKATEAKDFDIWFIERKDIHSRWSDPINIGEPVNTEGNEFYPSVSKFNTLYFTNDGIKSTGKDDIFVSKLVNGKYEDPLPVADSVNSTGYEFNSFIAPDESFLLYTCYNKKGGYGSGDLYISYNKGNGQWTAPANLGLEINSSLMDYCPFVNLNSGILYFTSKRSSVQKQFDKNLNAKEFLKEANKYENGLSRIYQVNIKSLLKK
ncbi:MAG: PD40 domain-containing protein, partial [Bacteroidetes bacterium]|nr:PD40 domain-containing protein [Bacteroidota bacterium]